MERTAEAGRPFRWSHCLLENARADPDESGTPGPFRLRVRAQWHRQSLHAVCSAEGWRHVKVTDRHTAVDYAPRRGTRRRVLTITRRIRDPMPAREHGCHAAGKRCQHAPIGIAKIGCHADYEEGHDVYDGGSGRGAPRTDCGWTTRSSSHRIPGIRFFVSNA
jgi:hypothetical protein